MSKNIMLQNDITAWNLIAATAGLFAFLLGFFTLVGRERKAPYIINSVLAIFVVAISGVVLDLTSRLLPQPYDKYALSIGLITLIIAVAMTLFQTYRVYLRITHFVDHISWKHFSLVRTAKRLWARTRGAKPTYEHNPIPFKQDFAQKLDELLTSHSAKLFVSNKRRSLAIKSSHVTHASEVLANITLLFLKEGLSVQYLTASRHPVDFLIQLKEIVKLDQNLQWDVIKNQLILIDAYSKHFAFLDSIYPKKTEAIRGEGIECLTGSMSFAGIHSAGARAFNLLKKKAGPSQQRQPFLVIYEDCYALADLESEELYRVFVRHVLPSEQQFGGMYTVIVESSIETRDWDLLTTYVDSSIEITKTEHSSEKRVEP